VNRANAREVDHWWSEQFGIAETDIWRVPTVRTHTVLGDYAGWFVAWSGSGVHISAPVDTSVQTLERMRATPAETLAGVGFWRGLGRRSRVRPE
jgi:hypothetical protein